MVALNMAEPPSSSLITTVPVANELAALEVVAVNAAWERPTVSTVTRSRAVVSAVARTRETTNDCR